MALRPPGSLFHLGLVLVVCLLTGVSVAQTGEPDPVTLKQEGDQAMVERRYKDALEKYDASYAKKPDPALHYNRGRAYESLGQFPEALAAFEAFVAEASPELKARVPKLDELLEEIRGKVSYLTVTTNASDARVLLDKQLVGTAPIERVAVNAGEAIVEVVAEGYHPSSQPVVLPGRETVTLEILLEAKDVRGTLVVRTDPEGASVLVDGKSIGRSPAETRLEPGSHALRLELDGYEPHETQTVVEPQEVKVVEAELDAIVTEQWWFWTSIAGAVVVTGVAVGLAVGLTPRAADEGDIAPGQIAVPLITF